jgi:hypothetical protein
LRRRLRCTLCLLCLFAFSTFLQAQTTRLTLVPYVSGLSSPVLLTNAHDGTNRRFIVEQTGHIQVVAPGSTTTTLFLDLTSRVLYGGERGLLGLAFHPQYATDRRFYVNYTRQPDGATVVDEYRDGAPLRRLVTIPQPYENHNGGMIEFGPDGYLYIGMGDGGSGNDPQNHAQNLNDLLGKMLRINVDAPSAVPEIYAYGLRNPWRYSFDRLTGLLYAGDVGQSAREEIDIITKGGNYGWRVWEGTFCTSLGPASCSDPGFIPPIADYVNTGETGRCAIIGGYIYRGTQATLPYGAYVYGDLCSGEIFMLKDGVQTMLLDTPLSISSFGEDEAGELYVVNINGSVFRLSNPDAVVASQRAFAIPDGAAGVSATAASAPNLTVGYGRIQANAGQSPPAGLAIFAYQQQGVLVSEAAVASCRSVLSARSWAEIGSNVRTGVALANPNNETAVVSFYVLDQNGANAGSGTFNIPAKQQFAAFLNEAPFNVGPSFFGSFTFTSSVALAATALRGFTNQRGDFLITTLPFFETDSAPTANTTIAQVVDGGGWSTQIFLMNPANVSVNGNLQFLNQSGQVVDTLPYSIPAGGSTGFSPAQRPGPTVQVRSIRLASPVWAVAVFSFSLNGVTVTQSGVPAVASGTSFEAYAEGGTGVRTGLAIANSTSTTANVTFEAAGATASVSIPPNGQVSRFLDEIPVFANLPAFQTTLTLTSDVPVAVTGLRGRVNVRGEFLISTTMPVDASAAIGGSEVFYPHFAEGAGYGMQFVVFGGASGTLYLVDKAGNPASLLFR